MLLSQIKISECESTTSRILRHKTQQAELLSSLPCCRRERTWLVVVMRGAEINSSFRSSEFSPSRLVRAKDEFEPAGYQPTKQQHFLFSSSFLFDNLLSIIFPRNRFTEYRSRSPTSTTEGNKQPLYKKVVATERASLARLKRNKNNSNNTLRIDGWIRSDFVVGWNDRSFGRLSSKSKFLNDPSWPLILWKNEYKCDSAKHKTSLLTGASCLLLIQEKWWRWLHLAV